MLEDTNTKNQAIKSLVKEVLDRENFVDEQLTISVVIIDSLTEEEQHTLNTNKYRDLFEGILNNTEFRRTLNKIKIINKETELALAYYGETYGSDPNVTYDEETQETIYAIKKEIREFLGIIMNHILKTEELDI